MENFELDVAVAVDRFCSRTDKTALRKDWCGIQVLGSDAFVQICYGSNDRLFVDLPKAPLETCGVALSRVRDQLEAYDAEEDADAFDMDVSDQMECTALVLYVFREVYGIDTEAAALRTF